MAVVQYDTGATASLVTSSFINKLSLFSRPKRVQISITSGIDGEPEEATLSHELYIKYPRGSAHAAQFLEVEKIRRLPQPLQEEILDVIFPHPDREEWVAESRHDTSLPQIGLHGGEAQPLHELPHAAIHRDGPDAGQCTRRSSWQSSGDSPRNTTAPDCASSSCPGLDLSPHHHRGGEPP